MVFLVRVSREQAARNVATATAIQERALGLMPEAGGSRYSDLAPQEQIALTNAVAAYILTRPDLFDTGAADLTNPFRLAAYATNSALENPNEYAFGQFVDEVASNARTINPLDPANAPTLGRNLLIIAALLGVVYVVAKTAPDWMRAIRGNK